MKLKWIFGLVFATMVAIPASAQISVYTGHPPPAGPLERRGPVPGPGYAWVDGDWAPQGVAISGCQDAGTVPPVKRPVGPFPVMSASGKAGS
jgi:hypothetical protein